MLNGKYVQIMAINVDGKYIPIWEFDYEYDEMIGDTYTHNDVYNRFTASQIKTVFYDLVKKEVVLMNMLELDEPPKFSVGEMVVMTTHGQSAKTATIREIVRGRLNREEVKYVNEMESYQKYYNLDVSKLNENIKYSVKFYDPAYIMEDGEVCKWGYQLYHLEH